MLELADVNGQTCYNKLKESAVTREEVSRKECLASVRDLVATLTTRAVRPTSAEFDAIVNAFVKYYQRELIEAKVIILAMIARVPGDTGPMLELCDHVFMKNADDTRRACLELWNTIVSFSVAADKSEALHKLETRLDAADFWVAKDLSDTFYAQQEQQEMRALTASTAKAAVATTTFTGWLMAFTAVVAIAAAFQIVDFIKHWHAPQPGPSTSTDGDRQQAAPSTSAASAARTLAPTLARSATTMQPPASTVSSGTVSSGFK